MLALSIAAACPRHLMQEACRGRGADSAFSARGATRPHYDRFAVPFSQRRRPL